MKVKDYVRLLNDEGLLTGNAVLENDLEKEVTELAYHTNNVTKGTLFICKGVHFKREFIDQAIAKGAILLVSEAPHELCGASEVTVNNIRYAMALLSAYHYGHPETELTKVGITGTKGKTTTAYYVKSMIDEYENEIHGRECAIFSSIDNYYGLEKEESHLTTPESPDLFKYMRIARDNKITRLVMEASSQGLKYDRLTGISFEVGAFLNISKDHISPVEHPDIEDYFSSKLKICDISKKVCVNIDSERFEDIKKKAGDKLITFGFKEEADYYAYYVTQDRGMQSFYVKAPSWERKFSISMKGIFNVSNALCAIAICDTLGISVSSMIRGLATAQVDGRMEYFSSSDGKINAIVDYAHNKLSFQKLFEAVKEEFPEKNIIALFGCPGYKAYDRRRDLPEVASNYCSHIYFTAEDSGEEPTESIMTEMSQYVSAGVKYSMIADRVEAVKRAFAENPENSVVVLTGKGREPSMKVGLKYIDHPSDVDLVKEIIEKYEKDIKEIKGE